MTMHRLLTVATLSATALLLGACGDNAASCSNCTPVTVQFNGAVSGLAAGTSLVLVDNNQTVTTVSSSSPSFSYQTVATSYAYPPALGVLVQPVGQTCSLTTGTASSTGAIAVTAACATTSGTPSQLTMLAGALARGSTDSTGIAASFSNPGAVAVNANGTTYVADGGNNTIRAITPAGVVTTLAGVAGVSGSTDGTGAAARFNNPNGIALDAAGNLYVADTGNQVIRLVTPAGVVTTVAGTALTAGAANGAGNAATFYWPMGIAVNAAGTMAYVTDYGSSTVRTISTSAAPMTSANTTVATLAGTAGMSGSANGTGASARFFGPQGLALDASGNLYIADSWNNAIRYINTTSGAVSTLTGMAGVAGSANGALAAATFYAPLDIAIDSQNNLYVADAGNSLIRKITLSSGTVSTVAGAVAQDIFSAGPLSQATLWQPTALAISGTAPSATLVLTTGNGVASINAVP